MEFTITGIVREKESNRPVQGLLVRAFDQDRLFADSLGNTITAADGTFSLGYEGADFQELFEKGPDIYLDIYGSATARVRRRVGDVPIHTTRRHVRFNAGRREFFKIEIPHDRLGVDAPGTRIVPTPEPGAWKELIHDYAKTHPIDYRYDSDKGFMAPLLECTSKLGPSPMNLMEYRGLGDSATVTVSVTNKGNGISFATYVEVYDGPGVHALPLTDYRLCDHKIITINPGQTVDVDLNWSNLLPRGRIIGICFDPFLDPRGFHVVEQSHDHIAYLLYY